MKIIFLTLSVLIFHTAIGQVENFDLLVKNIESSNIRTITKFFKSKRLPNGEKKYQLEFDKEGRLISIEEYEYFMGTEPIVMRQEIKYNEKGKEVAYHIKAPDGSTATDTLIYNDLDSLIKKQRIVKGQVVRTWNYSDKQGKNDEFKEFDKNGNLIKLTESNGDFTTYEYNSNENLTQKIKFQEGKENTKYVYKYNNKGRLTISETYLLYIGNGTNSPLTYYFEYEEFE